MLRFLAFYALHLPLPGWLVAFYVLQLPLTSWLVALYALHLPLQGWLVEDSLDAAAFNLRLYFFQITIDTTL